MTPDTPRTPSRQPRLTPDRLTTEQHELYRAITEGPRASGPQLFALTDDEGSLQGPFGGFLLSPTVGNALQGLGAAVRYGTRLSDRARELAILAVAAAWDSSFEKHAHEAVGRKVGLTEDEMATVASGEMPDLDDPVETAVLRLTRALLEGDVDDEAWSACLPPLDESLVFELTTLVGYYATLALQMRVLRVEAPDAAS